MDTQQQPPTIQETGRLKATKIPAKHVAKVAGVVVLVVLVAAWAFSNAYMAPTAAERALQQTKKSPRNAVVDEQTARQLGNRLERDARESIAAEAEAQQNTSTGLHSLRSMFDRRQQPGMGTNMAAAVGGNPYPYYQPPSYSSAPPQDQAATRKAEALRAQEALEQRAYSASKGSSLVAAYEEKPPPKAVAQTVASPVEQVRPVSAAIVKRAASEEQPKGQMYTLREGTIIDTVLVNGLNAAFAGPLKTQVTTDVPSQDRTAILIKAGSEFIGEAHRISEVGQERVAVSMKRLLRQDGFSMEFEEMPGLAQGGETALKDKVNHHYPRTFIVTTAMAALGGLAMVNSSGGYGYGDASEEFQRGFTSSMARSATRILDFFVRLPWDVTIRPGWRVEIFMMKDVELPAQEKL